MKVDLVPYYHPPFDQSSRRTFFLPTAHWWLNWWLPLPLPLPLPVQFNKENCVDKIQLKVVHHVTYVRTFEMNQCMQQEQQVEHPWRPHFLLFYSSPPPPPLGFFVCWIFLLLLLLLSLLGRSPCVVVCVCVCVVIAWQRFLLLPSWPTLRLVLINNEDQSCVTRGLFTLDVAASVAAFHLRANLTNLKTQTQLWKLCVCVCVGNANSATIRCCVCGCVCVCVWRREAPGSDWIEIEANTTGSSFSSP